MNKMSILLSIFLLLGCTIRFGQPPPNEDYGWIKPNVSLEQVRKEMLLCGFDNPFNNQRMNKNNYIISALCMEKNGYASRVLKKRGMMVCDLPFYQKYRACGGTKVE